MEGAGCHKRLCSIGGENCGGNDLPINTFSREEQLLLKVRSKNKLLTFVCDNHVKEFLTFFEIHQKKCCDPFKKHASTAASGVRTISLSDFQKSKQISTFAPFLVPGKKLCKRCHEEVGKILQTECGSSSTSTPSSSQDFATEIIMQAGGVENVIFDRSQLKRPLDEFSNASSEQDCTEAILMQAGSIESMIYGATSSTIQETGESTNEESNFLPPPLSVQPRDASTQETTQSIAHTSTTTSAPSDNSKKDPTFHAAPEDVKIDNINTTLMRPLNVSPVSKKRLIYEPGYGQRKVRRIETKCIELFNEAGAHPCSFDNPGRNFYEKMLDGLKEKFICCETYEEKIKVLSIPLLSLTGAQVLVEFGPIGATDYMIRRTCSLIQEQGTILPHVRPRLGKPLSMHIRRAVTSFYESDDLASRMMPGSKDFVSVVENGVRIRKQKRLCLCDLKELHVLFKEETNIQLSFSKFAALRPKHCILAGAAGTHSVCVCKYHQNFKLLCESSGLVGVSEGFPTYKDLIVSVLCEPPQENCFLLKCSKCPGTSSIQEKLRASFEDNDIETVTYEQWTQVDRCSLETITQSAEVYVDSFVNQLKALLPHHFISKTQSKYFKVLKDSLNEGEVVVILDFAQNYLCVIQDAIQSYYWKNDQVTLHPAVAYYQENGELKKLPLTMVSDYMKHNVSAVYAAQRKLIPFLKNNVRNFKKVKYFSDGAASQYKNKFNIYNLSYHETDFGIKAEWHFFATSHGKGACDGVAGSLKRNAKLASLKKTLIRNPREFYKWAKFRQDEHHGTRVCFVSNQDVEDSATMLKERSEKALGIPNIRSSHAFIALCQSEVLVKNYSAEETGLIAAVELQRKQVEWEDLQPETFVTMQVTAPDPKWNLGKILSIDPSSKKIRVCSLKKTKKKNSHEYQLPVRSDTHEIQLKEILTVVKPTEENRLYILTINDVNRASWQLQSKIHCVPQQQNEDEALVSPTPPFVLWEDIELETMVIVQVEETWALGKIIWTESETEEVIVQCFKPSSSRNKFKDSEDDDTYPFQLKEILLVVQPDYTNDIYTISNQDLTIAEERVRPAKENED